MAHHHAEASKIRRNVRTASRYMPVAIKRLEGKSLIGNPFGSVAICSVGARIVSSTPSGCFEFESCADELDYFGQCRGAKAKSSLDDAGFTTNVVCDVEGGCLSFTKCAHHLEALDRRIGRLQSLEAADRADQLLQLAVVSLDDVVQILDLSMQRFLWTFAFLLQLGESGRVGWRLVRVDDRRLFQSFRPLSTLPRKRFAAAVLRVGER